MAERPLLNLPPPTPIAPKPGPRGGAKISRPSRERQSQRLEPRFAQLTRVAQNPDDILDLREDPASIAPERAIVFEVEGSVEDFYAQARDLGLEYLGDFESQLEASPDFFDVKKPDEQLKSRIYLAMPNLEALRQLLSLWERYKQGKKMPVGKSAWRDLFSRLIDIRAWGPQDRIEEASIALWESDLQQRPDTPIRLEVELWYHRNIEKRQQAFASISQVVANAGGAIISHATIAEIHYDAALVDLPAAHVRSLIDNRNVGLARADDVMFLRPQSIVSIPARDDEGAEGDAAPADAAFAAGQPVVALFDGLPVQNHVRLANRLRIDDPDNLEATYPVAQRQHGTEMASLIIHGDLNRAQTPISRPLYVRPVLQPDARGQEHSLNNRLLVDLIYEAVRRMKVGTGGVGPAAPDVKVVNFSIGDATRPFAIVMSPLARLLDFLSYQYGLLFLVSAGNIKDRLTIPAFANSIEYEAADPLEREDAVLHALNQAKGLRTLLSPAEAMNVLTIGAAHAGSANGNLPPNWYDPYTVNDLPNLISAMGLGFKRVVKPELLFEGGRVPFSVVASNPVLVVRPIETGAQYYGVKTAKPSRNGNLRYEDFSAGTSVSTALASHAAHRIHDVLADAAGGSNHVDTDPNFEALMIKALLVHCAKWGSKGEHLDRVFGPQGVASHLPRRDDITRLLGYGIASIEDVLDCTENRATLVGYGTIQADGDGVLYRIPLPEDLNGEFAFRSVTTTLAWFSPVNPNHQGYRMAALDVSSGTENKYWIARNRNAYQPTDKAVVRGTIFHERRTAEEATIFVDDGFLHLRITCRAPAGALAGPVPYALAVSFEVGVDTGIQVYEQVKDSLAVMIRAGVQAGG
ncbi:MAG: S8 family peptidase [Pseudomonadota bacterium]